MISSIKTGIRKIFYWLPIIWQDRDWDEYFLYMILRHKMKSTERFFRTEADGLHAAQDANNIHRCIQMLNRLIDGNYNDLAFKSHDRKWGEIEMSWEDSKLNITRPNVTPENQKQERMEFNRWCKHEEYLRRQDLTYLFKLMQKHIRTWWD